MRLYDVIETDKYIGIILEYASGGELFDHILAHRYLREKDACKLFCQLISGVWYIHQKKIVHRDLKLENLLLDRNRNVIITDFGFANRFEHRADDLMQTSCGSPCYAAPELVISDGLYVGSAVDIWSCGVILYAMLAGYLPFDDDPANPDGDNINLLYKYIVNTPLSFPDYISEEARNLLSIMLVPDPARRADLPTIMAHHWLAPYAHIFGQSVDDLERMAMEQHHQKRLAYQRSMKQTASDSGANKIARSQSAATASGSRSYRAQPEYLYETSADMSVYSTPPSSARRGVNSATVIPSSSPMAVDDDPFAPPAGADISSTSVLPPSGHGDGNAREKQDPHTPTIAPVKSSPDSKRKGGFRHTIQVEYGTPGEEPQPQRSPVVDGGSAAPPRRSSSIRDRLTTSARKPVPSMEQVNQANPKTSPVTPVNSQKENAVPKIREQSKGEPAEPVLSIEVTSPPVIPARPAAEQPSRNGTTSSGSGGSTRSRHKRGLSMDKIGIAKLFSPSSPDVQKPQTNGTISRMSSTSQKSSADRAPSQDTIIGKNANDVHRQPSILQVPVSLTTPSATTSDAALLSPGTMSSAKKSRRNTLTVMVEPFRASLKHRTKGRNVTPESAQEKTPTEKEPAPPQTLQPTEVPKKNVVPPAAPRFSPTANVGSVPASTLKANKVMQWFRSKSKGRAVADLAEDAEKTPVDTRPDNDVPASTTSTVSQNSPEKGRSPSSAYPAHAASNAEPLHERSFASALGSRFGASSSAVARGTIRVHQGAVDQSTITTAPPPDVMKQVKTVLENMGVEIQIEGEYKCRCIRPKRKKTASGANGLREAGGGLAAFTIVGSAASNGVGSFLCSGRSPLIIV